LAYPTALPAQVTPGQCPAEECDEPPAAQFGGAPSSLPEGVATAIRVDSAPTIDGRLDDAVWAGVPAITGFTAREPVEGVPARDDTELRIIHTDEAIYIGARMYGDPAMVRRDVARRDSEGAAEQLVVSFDTYLDRRTAYTFVVTASGGRIDYYHGGDSQGNRDYSFDPVWEAAAEAVPDGWTAEMRIPFSQLRFDRTNEHPWGVNFVRRRPALQEESYWRLIRRDETGWSSRMGELRGLDGIRPARRIELQPYFASQGTFVSGLDADDPFADPSRVSARVGGDVSVGLGSSLTLSATFNPDFGQVEADPAVVNLGAFEVFFDERRPFFTEGARFLDMGNLFYSRRIGALPQGSTDADYAERAENTTILGAAKLTGQLGSGTTLGVLTAVTAEEKVSTWDGSSEGFGTAVVEPRAIYAVGRALQQFGSDASTVGGSVTLIRRDLAGHPALEDLLASSAVSGGLDGRFRWAGGKYDIGWRAAGTHVTGSEAAMVRQQRSSRRYFQRPDADYVQVDSTRTALSGYLLTLNHSKLSGEHWLWDIDLGAESPGFEPNDVGRLGNTDGLFAFAGLIRRETNPGRLFRNYRLSVSTQHEWNYGGVHTAGWVGANASGQFLNYWRVETGVDYEPPVESATLTRGGPLMRTDGFAGPFLAVSTPQGGSAEGTLRIGGGRIFAGGSTFWVRPSVLWRPDPRFLLSADPEYRQLDGPHQYVTTRDGETAATFGKRHIFARIEQRTISARIRANYALTPDLTLEAYLQPFASSGEYSAFGELAAPRSNDLRRYGVSGGPAITREEDGDYRVTDGASSFTFDDPGFHVRSFRSNLVLRWEWRPGSTLLVVWQQSREGDGSAGRAVPGDLLRGLGEEGDNYLAVKMTYWLPM